MAQVYQRLAYRVGQALVYESNQWLTRFGKGTVPIYIIVAQPNDNLQVNEFMLKRCQIVHTYK